MSAYPLRLVVGRSLQESPPQASYLWVRIIDHLECGHQIDFHTGIYSPTLRRRCRACAELEQKG